jgi:hypothetical protein
VICHVNLGVRVKSSGFMTGFNLMFEGNFTPSNITT